MRKISVAILSARIQILRDNLKSSNLHLKSDYSFSPQGKKLEKMAIISMRKQLREEISELKKFRIKEAKMLKK
jgi:hypothetical protein